MQRAAQLLNKKQISRGILTDVDWAKALWPAAVGKVIAAHTERVNLVRTTLVVEVEDAIWQKQLHTLRRQILDRLTKLTGGGLIQDIEFRVSVPRRKNQRAESRETSLSEPPGARDDEANSIPDPVLKKIYRVSRRKAVG